MVSHSTFNAEVLGSNPNVPTNRNLNDFFKFWGIVQLIEHLTVSSDL